MMPKGVEHDMERYLVSHFDLVRIPMMPKGVEHSYQLDASPRRQMCENSDDAERR